MKFPKSVNRYCPKCREHQKHEVSVYKKGKERAMNQGRRRVNRKKQGYGSFPKEIFRKNAKINKKSLPIFECTECGNKHYGKAYRVRKFELQQM